MTWPFENDTGSTVKKLAERSLKARKNTIAILSIVLAAVMFTSVFTIAVSMNDTWEESAMRGILGWPIGSVLAPLVVANQGVGDTKAVTSANPIIFAAAMVFALLTVFISCRKPARFAGKVSPIEAIRYVDAPAGRKKERNAKPVTAFRMARQNLGRGKKKVIVVTLSLTLSLVILNTAFAFFQTFDFNKYVSSELMTDFTVSDAPIISGNTNADPRLSSIDQPLQAQIESLDGLEASGGVYLRFLSQFYTDDMIQRMYAIGQNPVVAASPRYQRQMSSMGRVLVNTLGIGTTWACTGWTSFPPPSWRYWRAN